MGFEYLNLALADPAKIYDRPVSKQAGDVQVRWVWHSSDGQVCHGDA